MPRLRWLFLAVLLCAASLSFADTVDLCPWCTNPQFTTNATPIIFGYDSNGVANNGYGSIAGVTVSNGGASITIGGFTITGFVWNGTAWTSSGVHITGRSDASGDVSADNDHGLGVCSETITPGSPHGTCGTVAKDDSELNNQTNYELLQISRAGQSTDWTGFGLSSLDTNLENGGQGASFVEGQAFTSNSAPGSTFSPNSFADFQCTFEWHLTIPGPGQVPAGQGCQQAMVPSNPVTYEASVLFNNKIPSDFLYIWAFNPVSDPTVTGLTCAQYVQIHGSIGDGSCRNNDFLVRSITADIPQQFVPEPASLMLFGSGLAGLGISIRRKLRR